VLPGRVPGEAEARSLFPVQPDEATSRHAKLKASRAIYLAAPSAEDLLTLRQKLFVPQGGSAGSDSSKQVNHSIIAAAPQSRWHPCERGFFREDVHFLFQDELSRREGDERVHVSRMDAEGNDGLVDGKD
jgi:hypothetical protein